MTFCLLFAILQTNPPEKLGGFFDGLIARLMIYTFTLGRHKLSVSLNRRSGRPGKTLVNQLQEYISRTAKLAKDRRYSGNPVSRVLRRLFENKKTKRFLGLNLTVFVLFTGIIVPPISALTENPQAEITAINPEIVKLTTEHSVRVPIDSFRVTQGYHLFHRAVDFADVSGSPVYPIMDGLVENVTYQRFAYGNHIIINHGSGFKSLYAHLSKIFVKEGDEVDKNTVIGTIGSTGWATGSHLHLEVWDNGRPFNPLTILK